MKYLLDTNICVYFLNNNTNVVERIGNMTEGELAISIVTLAELQFGAYNSVKVQRNLERIAFLVASIPVLPLTPIVTDCYGKIKASLRRKGRLVDDFNVLEDIETDGQKELTIYTKTVRLTLINIYFKEMIKCPAIWLQKSILVQNQIPSNVHREPILFHSTQVLIIAWYLP
jgi:tRNA(fMet)-specific endonuclease VapC